MNTNNSEQEKPETELNDQGESVDNREIPKVNEDILTSEELPREAVVESSDPYQIFFQHQLSQSPDSYLYDLLYKCGNKLFRDSQKKTYAVLPDKNSVKIFEIESAAFMSYVTFDYFNQMGTAIKKQYLKQIIGLVDSLARQKGEIINLEIRCNWDEGSIVYDLHDEDHHVVRINSNGWKVELCQKPLFKSYPHQLPQRSPVEGGTLDDFLNLLNVAPEDRLVFKVFIVSLFIPGFPHPILKIEGEKGAAKSTATRLLKSLVDPSVIGLLSFPRESREIVQQLDHHYFIGYDNLSGVPRWASDALCRAVSGDGYSCRKLHTSDEDIIRSFKRCLSINGIDLGALPEDLLDRCLIINFKRISEENRKTDKEIHERFNAILPGVLHEIFCLISSSMNIYPSVSLTRIFRLADFTSWGYAIAQAINGQNGGEHFITDYQKMVRGQEAVSYDDNVLLASLAFFGETKTEWEGSPLQLYTLLQTIVSKQRLDQSHASWPKAPNYLMRRLNAYQSLLQSKGIKIEYIGRTATLRRVKFSKLQQPSSSGTVTVET